MNSIDHCNNQSIWEKLSSLKKSVDREKKIALRKRLSTKPQATKLEYLLGAFIEMYEPHLEEFIYKLAKRGYAIDASSGFGGKNSEFQTITGDFSLNYVTHNKLEKNGVRFREYNGSKSLIFWPEEASIDHIKTKWTEIVKIFPDKGNITTPSVTTAAVSFRRKYIPEELNSQKERLFDRLKYTIQRKVESDIRKRIKENPHPSKTEYMLGLFVEELEPQVRQAVLNMNKKGYSTDVSGFMDDACYQMIEGDFKLEEKTVKILEAVGSVVETNPSGYTRIQFASIEADISRIKRRWNNIISLLPEKNQSASISMTKKARDFRLKYQ